MNVKPEDLPHEGFSIPAEEFSQLWDTGFTTVKLWPLEDALRQQFRFGCGDGREVVATIETITDDPLTPSSPEKNCWLRLVRKL